MTSKLLRNGLAAALLAAPALSGCAVFKTAPPLTAEVAYQRGMAAYRAQRWGRAATLLQTWVDAAAGDARLPEVLYALGRSRMETGEYLLASATMLRIVTDYSTNPLQRDARFRVCEAYHHLSPRSQLDQENTRTALLYCSSYAEYYPQTPQADTAKVWVAGMREKLARKEFDAGAWYARRGFLDAAVIYFQRAATEYPDTPVAPSALFRLAETYDRLGYKEEAAEARVRLRRDFPQSPEARSPPADSVPTSS
jgi:outer membrane protein assembly factor BamD